jgi:hypothetical protein
MKKHHPIPIESTEYFKVNLFSGSIILLVTCLWIYIIYLVIVVKNPGTLSIVFGFLAISCMFLIPVFFFAGFEKRKFLIDDSGIRPHRIFPPYWLLSNKTIPFSEIFKVNISKPRDSVQIILRNSRTLLFDNVSFKQNIVEALNNEINSYNDKHPVKISICISEPQNIVRIKNEINEDERKRNRTI